MENRPEIDARGEEARQRLRQRKAFTRFTETDAAMMTELKPMLERHADGLVTEFYEHLRCFEPLRLLLLEGASVEHLQHQQRAYLIGLASGDYGDAYVESRHRIGQAHERIGLSPQWYLGTYGLYFDRLLPLIQEEAAELADRGLQRQLALSKLLLLDMQIVLDAYYSTRERHAVRKSEQLAAVGELAASIAHEVRNPLAGIKGALQILLRDEVRRPEHAEVLEEVLAQIGRLEGLVRDLLTYANPRRIERQVIDLERLLERHLRQVEEQSTGSTITVRRDYDRNAQRLVVDPQQMEQVVLNLVQNACQAMVGGGTLTVSTRLVGTQTTISIADTGKGIPEDVQSRVFTPFFTTRHRGSGLGLPIVRKIVEDHGGSIELESRVGQGTTVRVRLPYGEEP